MNRSSATAWLAEAATYFGKRPTGGEDMAYWANVSNAEACRKIAALLESDTTERQPRPREDDQNIDWKARAEYFEASLSTLKSRIDVEGMARIVDPDAWAWIDKHLAGFREANPTATPDDEWSWKDCRTPGSIAKAQALRTLILGEE